MSDEMPPPGVDELPEVDEVLAESLVAQGAKGKRALGLLRDARRVLAGSFLERPAEVAESCLRGAADAVLSLPGAADPRGLKAATAALLDAVDALPDPLTAPAAGEHVASGGPRRTRAGAGGRGAAPGRAGTAGGEVVGVWEAAQALRGQLASPGGFHRARAAGIAERLTGAVMGSAQARALDEWGEMYNAASGTLHGGAADRGRAAALYRRILTAARELLVPLPARAARVLELAALTAPGEKEARELAGWVDPRAEAFFFRSGPAAAWLDVLQEHAPHLLQVDEVTGFWPAAPFFIRLAATAPESAMPWLASHAVQLAAAGQHAVKVLLHLAIEGTLGAAEVRLLLPYVLAPARAGEVAEEAGFSRRMAARWAGTLDVAARDGDWVLVAEALLKDVVDVEYAAFRAMRAVNARHGTGGRAPAGPGRRVSAADLEAAQALKQGFAARLPDHDIAGLLRELVATVHRTAGGPFRWARAIRGALAGLLRHDLDAGPAAVWSSVVDLDEERLREGPLESPLAGPFLARAVLELAAADAAAGVVLAERTRAWPRIAAVHPVLHDRLLAAHLTAHPPAAHTDSPGAGKWWDRAIEATVRLLAVPPPPEGARLAALVLRTCPGERAADLHQRARAALGPAPSAAEVDRALPADLDQAGTADHFDAGAEQLASWLRVWAWSPVLPAQMLADFTPLLDALRQQKPAGPPDPRTTARPGRDGNAVALETEAVRELAATAGPLAAAAALAEAPDAGADGYARVLNRVVGADSAGWTADVPGVLAALARPELRAFYLDAVAGTARRPGALPAGPAPAALAALTLRRALPAPAAGDQPSRAVQFADRALADLLHVVWRTGADLAGDLPGALDQLYGLAEHLTRPAGDGADEQELVVRPPKSDPAVRALDCLLDYAASLAAMDGQMPADVLHLLSGVLVARPGDDAVATVIGEHLPVLHRRATAYADAHSELYALTPGRLTPAVAWMRDGRLDPQLLAALDRGQLLAALREKDGLNVSFRVVDALLNGHPGLLGDPAAAWREVAAGPGGDVAAERLLATFAISMQWLRAPSAELAPGRSAADTATEWWTAALEAGLPPGALAGAGHFSHTLTDEVWLPLARRSAEHTPHQIGAGDVAARAAAHPNNPDALLLLAHLLAPSPAGPWPAPEVRRNARTLLQAALALPAAARPTDAAGELRRALIDAGEIDAARI
ncbi:hypothetical protein ACIQ7Q_34245 [Streptomyces sp. NPDC096176]|uniref:hypothetical protein n=1 Tax=Streptomyces sp. NPDC096176 TaxID=3366079 RepID=UPI0037F32026